MGLTELQHYWLWTRGGRTHFDAVLKDGKYWIETNRGLKQVPDDAYIDIVWRNHSGNNIYVLYSKLWQ